MTRGAQADTAGQTRIISIDGPLPDGQCEPGIGDRLERKCPLDPTFEREPSSLRQSPKAILVDFQRPNLRPFRTA
jgi:hypothetical protein